MIKPYLIIINGSLAECHVTKLGALKAIQKWQKKGVKAVIAYRIEKEN